MRQAREYRGQSNTNKKWVYGCLVDRTYGCYPVIVNQVFSEDDGDIEFEYELVDPNTIQECTGVYDIDSKKAFTGDICDVCFNGIVKKAIVKYNNTLGAFCFKLLTSKMEITMADVVDAMKRNGDYWWFKIIGNEVENPELLSNSYLRLGE